MPSKYDVVNFQKAEIGNAPEDEGSLLCREMRTIKFGEIVR